MKNQIHILPGDSLAQTFPKEISGERIICRECLIVGNLQGETLAEFWQTRADFIKKESGENSYFEKSVSEFEKIDSIDLNTEINLWFEYELFCQTNLWFVLYLLKSKDLSNIFLILPIVEDAKNRWKGFGNLGETDLEKCFDKRIKLTANDLNHGAKLWEAYKANDLKSLEKLSHFQSVAFPYLKEVCQAEIERKQDNRVENSVREIIKNGATEFSEVFRQFQAKEGVYGFGDSQVKPIFEQIISK
ncbi:MAG: DUF1835 domain-containing protein [Acidobacteriota bacterium]